MALFLQQKPKAPWELKSTCLKRVFGLNLKPSDCNQYSEDSHVVMQLCPCWMQNSYPAGKVCDRFDDTKGNPEKWTWKPCLAYHQTKSTLVNCLDRKSLVMTVIMPTSVFSDCQRTQFCLLFTSFNFFSIVLIEFNKTSISTINNIRSTQSASTVSTSLVLLKTWNYLIHKNVVLFHSGQRRLCVENIL